MLSIPFWARILAKIIISRIGVSYNLWNKINLFRHGMMDSEEYSYKIFMKHFNLTGYDKGTEFVTLELGPGDSLNSALIAKAHGSVKTYLVDVGDYATKNLEVYRNMEILLKNKGFHLPDIAKADTITEIMDNVGGVYLKSGLKSLKIIPSNSVDFIFSEAVLEHIRQAEFFDVLVELRRVLKTNGICTHTVDLKDHLGGGLNNLRFSRNIWESRFFSKSGFYTNRIRYYNMLALFKKAGFSIECVKEEKFRKLPLPIRKMSAEYKRNTYDDLIIASFEVTLR